MNACEFAWPLEDPNDEDRAAGRMHRCIQPAGHGDDHRCGNCGQTRAVAPTVGELTGLPLSRFATAELIARAGIAGFPSLWSYVTALEEVVEEEGIWHRVYRRGEAP
jgi:hypothetical protein